jgi:uncharacterized protein with von Willebrand factor type A (vWA) domain
MQLGDARTGKMAENIVGFGRALRRAGLPMDSARISLALDSALLVGLDQKSDFRAALQATMVCRQQDLDVFEQLFDAYFRNPELTQQLLSQMLPKATEAAAKPKRRPRVQEALAAVRAAATERMPPEEEFQFDAAMTASMLARLHHADFAGLNASEFRLVERLVREMTLPWPQIGSRRLRPSTRGVRLDWARTSREAARYDGELLRFPFLSRRQESLPLLILLDVSGSMERYARLMLAFLHQSTRHINRSIFAFGNQLTDLSKLYRLSDTDAMLEGANRVISDFAGGTQMGNCLATLRLEHHRKLVGHRTVVLLISDGLDTGQPNDLKEELHWLRRNCRSLLWLNPLLRFEGYQASAGGAQLLQKHADGVLAMHNLAHLEALSDGLAQLLKR